MEQPEFDVVLTGDGRRTLDAVQTIRAATGLSAWRSSELLRSVPAVIMERTHFEAAMDAVNRVRAAGVDAALSCGACERRIAPDAIPVSSGACVDWSVPPCPASSKQ